MHEIIFSSMVILVVVVVHVGFLFYLRHINTYEIVFRLVRTSVQQSSEDHLLSAQSRITVVKFFHFSLDIHFDDEKQRNQSASISFLLTSLFIDKNIVSLD